MQLQLNITDPKTGYTLSLLAEESVLNGHTGWTVTMGQAWFFMAMQHQGQWHIIAGHPVSFDLLDTVGTFLHPLAICNLMNLNNHR